MEILRGLLLVLHFVGLASILGGVIVQISQFKTGTARVTSAIMHGAWLQLITGIALVGVIQAAHFYDINNTKIGVKLALLIVITVIAFVNRKKTQPAAWVVPVIGALTFVEIMIAVLWR